jgi:hypothetical protein
MGDQCRIFYCFLEIEITVELSTAFGKWGSLLDCLLLIRNERLILNRLLLLGDGDHC